MASACVCVQRMKDAWCVYLGAKVKGVIGVLVAPNVELPVRAEASEMADVRQKGRGRGRCYRLTF
jgi:hypothetical protein